MYLNEKVKINVISTHCHITIVSIHLAATKPASRCLALHVSNGHCISLHVIVNC